MKHIAIIDSGAGNLHSVYKAFKYIGANVVVTNDSKTVEASDAVIFPGVGAFGAVVNHVRKSNLEDLVIKQAKSSKPFLGICVAMQVLFEDSEENPEIKGLGILKGKVIKFKKAKKVPHIGWNDVTSCVIARSEATKQSQNEGNKFYFVHSYYVVPEDKSVIVAKTKYDGEDFASIIKRDNLMAVQFHPEKSGNSGLELLKNFFRSI